MGEIKIEVKKFRCDKCGHTWENRNNQRPRMCPKCKTVRWDDEKTNKK